MMVITYPGLFPMADTHGQSDVGHAHDAKWFSLSKYKVI
jgi:hypothetical protein